MGLDINAVRFLVGARKRGVELGEVLMLGRQDLNVYPAKTKAVLERHGFPAAAFAPGASDSGFAEPLFEALGASSVSALDASDFEGAQFVHDLNRALPQELKQRFDTVYDGGTLEHVFNFPQALQSCMEMLRPGGHLFLHTIANNWTGHGFYQFSPELFFKAFSSENGFKMEQMIAHMVGPYGRWFEVTDPEQIRSRVEVVTMVPLHLLVMARRVAAVPVFAKAPQQTDYSERWVDPSAANEAVGVERTAWSAARPALSRTLPGVARLCNVMKTALYMYYNLSLRNRRNFRPVKKP